MTDFWIGSREWGRWWDGEPATVVRRIESDDPPELTLVELERTGERVLLGRHVPVPVTSGKAVGVIVYRAPEGWDEHSPLRSGDLRFASEPELYARQEDVPQVSQEHREQVRRGWA